ncbi:hypothetical protein JCM16303_003642 [Sporobolomyces ruberrimus]
MKVSPSLDLSNLQLSAEHLLLSTPLPSLRSLTLSSSLPLHLRDFLGPATLPSLRYLALDTTSVGARNFEPDIETSMLGQLLPQLDACSIDARYLQKVELLGPSIFGPFMSRTLVDWAIGNDRYPFDLDKIEHLRLLHPTFASSKQLARFVTAFTESPSIASLRSIYIDAVFLLSSGFWSDFKDSATELEVECKKRGIEVIYEDQARDPAIDSIVSQEFWRRMTLERQQPNG